jgi:hypothetical protein
MCPASARSLHTPFSWKLGQMCRAFAMALSSHPGWSSARKKQVSGGRVLYTRTRKVKNRAAIALRLGAHCLYHAQNYLGEFYRKMKWRLDAPEAVTATAHKLARIVYHLLSTREPYSESVFVRCDQQTNARAKCACASKPPTSAFSWPHTRS